MTVRRWVLHPVRSTRRVVRRTFRTTTRKLTAGIGALLLTGGTGTVATTHTEPLLERWHSLVAVVSGGDTPGRDDTRTTEPASDSVGSWPEGTVGIP